MASTGRERNHKYFQDLLGAYVLWALSPEERAELEEHLQECKECKDEVARLRATREALPYTTEHRDPPAGLRESLQRAVREDRVRIPGKAAYDVIIVGARCAGSPTAMLLAQRGYRVLLVDRATFPSDTLSTHLLQATGANRLKQWGLLEQVEASGCPPITTMGLNMHGMKLTGSPPPANGVNADYAPRRTILDTILVEAAANAGAEMRERFAIQELVIDDGRVIGVRGRGRNGGNIPEYARLVVGADGRRSLVAREVKAPSYHAVPSLTACFYAYWSNVSFDSLEIYAHNGRAAIAFPTNDDQMVVLVEWPRSEYPEFRSDIEGNYLKTLDLFPELAERVRVGQLSSRVMGTADLPNFFRRPYGTGWALVGDAGYHKDPITLQGMTDAFRDAELLARAIDAAYGGTRTLQAALMQYERERNEAAMPMYSLTQSMASLRMPPPQTLRMMEALQSNPVQADRFFGTLTGSVPMDEFFSPENMQRILASAES